MNDYRRNLEVFQSSPFERPASISLPGDGGEIYAQRGFHDDERSDLGRVTVSFAGYGLSFENPEDVEKYRTWVNTNLDAASAAAFGSDATDSDSGV